MTVAQRTAADVESRTSERAAREALRAQIARLERQLGEAVVAAFPRSLGRSAQTRQPTVARVLDLTALERRRDELAERLRELRESAAERGASETKTRLLLEEMLRDPARHRGVRVANADLGGGGCGVWRVKPRLGLIGMLAGWWHVKLSSGCPLAT